MNILYVYVCILSLRQSWWKANNYFNLLTIMHLISLMCFSKKPRLCGTVSDFCVGRTLLLPRDSLQTVRKNNDQWACSLLRRMSLTSLTLQHNANGWALIWKQGSGNHKGWAGDITGEWRGWWRDRDRERGRDTQFVIAFFAVLNPLEMEVFHINMHCIIPSRRANCFL